SLLFSGPRRVRRGLRRFCASRRREADEYGTLSMSLSLNSPTEPRTKAPNSTTTADHLRALEAESIHIMREVVAEFERPVMLYSIGKDSSVLLRLAQKAFHPGPIPFPLLHVDTTYKFREMIEFRNWYAKEIGARLIV